MEIEDQHAATGVPDPPPRRQNHSARKASAGEMPAAIRAGT